MPPNDCNRQPGGSDCSGNSNNNGGDCSNALRQSAYSYGQANERVGPFKRIGRALFGRHDGGPFTPQQQQYRPVQQYQPLAPGYSPGVALQDGSGFIQYNSAQGQTYLRPADGTRVDVGTNKSNARVESYTEGPWKGLTRISNSNGTDVYERKGAKEKPDQEQWFKSEKVAAQKRLPDGRPLIYQDEPSSDGRTDSENRNCQKDS